MTNQKPWFSKEQVDQLIQVFKSELAKDNKTLTDAQVDELRDYVQSRKHPHENIILRRVLDGEYVCSVQGDKVAYKVALPDDFATQDQNPDSLESKYKRAVVGLRQNALNHSMIQSSLFGKEKYLSFSL